LFTGFKLVGVLLSGINRPWIVFLIAYFLYLIQVYTIAKIKFEFSFDSAFIKIFGIQLSLAAASFLAVIFLNHPYPYFVGAGLILISSWYSIKELDKRLGLKTLFQNIKNRF